MVRVMWALILVAAVAACDDDGGVIGEIATPTNLYYDLDPSGDPDAPAGLLLFWDPVSAADLLAYRVYSRPTTSGPYDLRGETTSTTFHDVGVPDLDYAVSAVSTSGAESGLVEVRIDERLRLPRPTTLVSTSLNAAVYLGWTDNAFVSDPEGFRQYRVYSSSYSLDTQECGTDWGLEGTTVAPEFIAGALTNGQPRCFAVSAESIEGWESVWSPLVEDTPRPDARNAVLWADAADASQAGFRFFQDLNANGLVDATELGLIGSSASLTMDFYLYRDPSGDLFFVPVRAGTTVAQYGTGPVDDLTAINEAPLLGFDVTGIEVLPGYGYVFEMDGGDGFARYGAIRPTHVGQNFIIFDWSYQTDPGNPELSRHGGLPTAEPAEVVIRRR
jgi:hypothetical protein